MCELVLLPVVPPPLPMPLPLLDMQRPAVDDADCVDDEVAAGVFVVALCVALLVCARPW